MSKSIKIEGHKGTPNQVSIILHNSDGEVDESAPLPLYLDEVNHSPDGFNWGYLGSGPAQLAYALLRKFFGKEWAMVHYQDFKRYLIADLPDSFEIEFEVLNNYYKSKS